MRSGLSQQTIGAIVRVLERHPEVERATLFGSRALGREQPQSDIDLALAGDLDDLDVERIALELDELQLPQRFDLTDESSIRHAPLRDHIARVGKVLYRRDDATRCSSPSAGVS